MYVSSVFSVAPEETSHHRHNSHPAHGIIPDKTTQLVIDYYARKGKLDVAAEHAQNLTHKKVAVENLRAVQKQAMKVHRKQAILPDGEVIKVYDSKNTEKLRVKLRREGSTPFIDVSVNEAYNGAVATYTFLKDVFHLKSIDDKGFPLISNVHFGKKYNNAFWNGEEMVYGDGDGKIFNRFTIAIDIAAHEQAHGLTQERAGTAFGKAQGIDYEGESGGINESYSDIFGSMIKQYNPPKSVFHTQSVHTTAKNADWLIGEGLIKKGNLPLRSMLNPGNAYKDHPVLGTDSQISNYADYVTRSEFEEVDPHDSSGISNKAFAKMAVELEGFSWDIAGRIFFEALPHIKHDATFKDLANITLDQVAKSYGKGGREYACFMKGWKEVGVL